MHLSLSVPVPHIQEQIVEAIKVIPQEQMAERIVEQIVDVLMPQIQVQFVDVPVPQIMEETVEVATLLVVLPARRTVPGRGESGRSPRRAQPVAAALFDDAAWTSLLLCVGSVNRLSQDTLGHGRGDDDAPMPEKKPPEPFSFLIDMPPGPASAPRMSNLERCMALQMVYGAGPR